MRNLMTVSLSLLLAGCFYNQTDIQGEYERTRISCQSLAENKIDHYSEVERNEKDRNAELVTLFSDCMAKEGWQVATPKREVSPAGAQTGRAPIGNKMGDAMMSPAQNAPQAATTPYRQQAPVVDGAVQTQATPLSPSGSMPPLRQPVNPNAATYQPAPYSEVPAYGTGPGRSF